MSQYFYIHPENPQKRLLKQAALIIQQGGLIAYPTDSAYALGCAMGERNALQRMRVLRALDVRHQFSLVCRDLSQIASYAKVDNSVYRLLKNVTPGPFTFLLNATKEVPKRLHGRKRQQIGIRVPDNEIVRGLLAELDAPLLSTTLILPNQTLPMSDAEEIRELLEHQLDLVINGGHCGLEPTTVVDLSGSTPELIRQGKGDFNAFL